MKVVAVSRALPEWHDVRGRQVFTSIVRGAHPGPLPFGPEGPPDNQTAVHTEHVLAFSAEHYDHWTREFGIERQAWDWCHWGENLTVAGIDENDLRIGDVLRAGDAVFQVTSPRIPCFKLAWRIGQPDSCLHPMIQSGRIGFYLRVLQPGTVAAGDRIALDRTNVASITVGDLSRLLVDPAVTDPARLAEVLAAPGLGGQATGMLRMRMRQLEDKARERDGRWDGWREFVVHELFDEAHRIRSFQLVPADDQPIAPHRAGQFLTVRLPDGLVRSWSISDYRDGAGSYRITVKEADEPQASRWMHRAASTGTRLQVRAPAGRFVLDRGALLRNVLISAGIGVTPLFAMLRAQTALGEAASPLLWLHSTENGDTHAFRDECRAIFAERPEFVRQVHYTRAGADDAPGVDHDRQGRIGEADIAALLTGTYRLSPFGRSIELPGTESQFFVCGPAAFEAAIRTALLAGGARPEQIRSEAFGPAASGGGPAAVAQAEVRFSRAGQTATWTAEQGGSLLELAEAAGLAPAFGCRMGNCQACEVRLVSGEIVYDPAPVARAEAGHVLLCCARPASAEVELDL